MTSAFAANGLFGNLFCDAKVADAFVGDALLAQMLRFERAWTAALIETGAVSAADGKLALGVIDGFTPDRAALSASAERDGLPVPELVRQLRHGQSNDVQRAIHTGATSQDVIDTAMVLTCRDILADFDTRLRGVSAQLDVLDGRFGDGPMMGRTRMQAALPITVADRIRAWRQPLEDHVHGLTHLLEMLLQVQVGGAVGVRDAQREKMTAHVAQALGLNVTPVWHADRSCFVSLGNWLVLLSGSLGKLGLDVGLMAQQGVDEVVLSGAGGSSAMPHKQNPIRAEALVTLARYVAGQQGILSQAMLHEQERSGAAWALEWMVLPAMFEATGTALNRAGDLLNQIDRLGQTS